MVWPLLKQQASNKSFWHFQGSVTCVTSNESGTLALSGGRDGKLCLWQWGKDHFFHQVRKYQASLVGVCIAPRQHTCISPISRGLDSQLSRFFSEEKLLMMLRLINGGGQRKVDSGLKMLIEPIQFWLVANQYKKASLVGRHLIKVPELSSFTVTIILD